MILLCCCFNPLWQSINHHYLQTFLNLLSKSIKSFKLWWIIQVVFVFADMHQRRFMNIGLWTSAFRQKFSSFTYLLFQAFYLELLSWSPNPFIHLNTNPVLLMTGYLTYVSRKPDYVEYYHIISVKNWRRLCSSQPNICIYS